MKEKRKSPKALFVSSIKRRPPEREAIAPRTSFMSVGPADSEIPFPLVMIIVITTMLPHQNARDAKQVTRESAPSPSPHRCAQPTKRKRKKLRRNIWRRSHRWPRTLSTVQGILVPISTRITRKNMYLHKLRLRVKLPRRRTRIAQNLIWANADVFVGLERVGL